jgi:hypothetical protein
LDVVLDYQEPLWDDLVGMIHKGQIVGMDSKYEEVHHLDLVAPMVLVHKEPKEEHHLDLVPSNHINFLSSN